jgi:S1-C subfamily serine protease
MKNINPWHLLFTFALVLGLTIGLQLVLFNTFKQNMQEEFLTAQEKLLDEIHNTEQNVIKTLNEEKNRAQLERSMLENRTNDNFEKLTRFVTHKTSQLQLDLETKVTGVAIDLARTRVESEKELETIAKKVGGLQKKSSELDSKISEIDVSSKDFSSIVEEVIQSVANIQTDTTQGSGVFVTANGHIVTNKHVVGDASIVKVTIHNGRIYDAVVIHREGNADIAILKINETTPWLGFASSENVRVGERVIAVGSPLGLSFSVTEGIISATNRRIDTGSVGYIQTDVPINSGNSGGPLVNSKKKIVGINTLKYTQAEGIGFAIPADIVQASLKSALQGS